MITRKSFGKMKEKEIEEENFKETLKKIPNPRTKIGENLETKRKLRENFRKEALIPYQNLY